MTTEQHAVRTLSDADIAAIAKALKPHAEDCRFEAIEPRELLEIVEAFKNFNRIAAESKGVVRKTILVILVTGICGLIYVGAGVKVKNLIGL